MRLPGKVTYFILLSLGASSIAFGVHMIGLSTPYWRLISVKGLEIIRSGLWKTCFVSSEVYEGFLCNDMPDHLMDKKFKTVQGSVLISLLLILVGGVFTTAALALARENLSHTKLLYVATVVDFLAVISSVVSIVVYGVITNKYKKEKEEANSNETIIFGWSFILEIITTVLLLMAGIMALVHIRMKDECRPRLPYETDINTITAND